jgi:predicted dehydrogenase
MKDTRMTEHGIAIMGAGTIVTHAHLPAYREAGLPVVGIFDEHSARAAALANDYGITCYRGLEELLEDPRVTIVDTAITPQAQRSIAVQAALAGKHVLAQKPLGASLVDAIEMVRATRHCSTVLAVNQQMRWEANTAATKRLLEAGELGEPIAYMIDTNMSADFPADHWLAHESRLMALYGAVHNVDAARFLLGDPRYVRAMLPHDPLQVSAGELWINAWLEWDGGARMTLNERYTNWAGDVTATVRFEGTRGTVRGTFGMWDNYPHPSPGTTEFKRHGDREWTALEVGATWIPGAFAGPMLDLIQAAETGGEACASWKDNLRSLAVVEAIYAADVTNVRVQLDLDNLDVETSRE